MASTLPLSVAATFHVHMPLPENTSMASTRGPAGGGAGNAASGTRTAGCHGVYGGCGGRGGGGQPVGITGATGGAVVGGATGASDVVVPAPDDATLSRREGDADRRC